MGPGCVRGGTRPEDVGAAAAACATAVRSAGDGRGVASDDSVRRCGLSGVGVCGAAAARRLSRDGRSGGGIVAADGEGEGAYLRSPSSHRDLCSYSMSLRFSPDGNLSPNGHVRSVTRGSSRAW
jgi:hypothetical protein